MFLEGPFLSVEPVGQYGRHIIWRQRRDGHEALWIFEKRLYMDQVETKKKKKKLTCIQCESGIKHNVHYRVTPSIKPNI